MIASFLVIGIIAYGSFLLLQEFQPASVSFFVALAISLALAPIVRRFLEGTLRIFPEAEAARKSLMEATQREGRTEILEEIFRDIIRGWSGVEEVVIWRSINVGVGANRPDGFPTQIAFDALKEMKWATPERLARERGSDARSELGRFLGERGLGVLVLSEGAYLSVVVGVGTAQGHRPYTYPQIVSLIELSAIIESALERAHFSSKVQHTEQLATVGLLGASLAHEVRNPLVSIKTFVQLLPTHYQDPVFREKFFRLIGDEVARIDQLTQQLLELSAPKTFRADWVEVNPIIRASVELVATKAFHRKIELRTQFDASPDRAYTDGGAAKQVIINLCFNAIQALETLPETSTRWIRISSRNVPNGIEIAVEDSGPGIAPEIRAKLFQPFQTTKSKGFGLGLAICSDILANLGASITADPAEPGRGAAFRVVFPCHVPSS